MADTLGRVVWARTLGHQGAGTHEVALDGLSLPAGAYLVRISGAGSTAVSRFVRLAQ